MGFRNMQEMLENIFLSCKIMEEKICIIRSNFEDLCQACH